MMKKKISTDKAPQAIGPYSQAIVCGTLVFTSGQLPVNRKTNVMAEGIENQAHMALTNLKNTLEASGSSLDHVLKCTLYLKHLSDFNTINEIYKQYFTMPFPARSCVEAARLPLDALIEIEAVAEVQ